jgi:hypothetical protein
MICDSPVTAGKAEIRPVAAFRSAVVVESACRRPAPVILGEIGESLARIGCTPGQGS